jgi:hypothetical protein
MVRNRYSMVTIVHSLIGNMGNLLLVLGADFFID